jgi:hypothetical protein
MGTLHEDVFISVKVQRALGAKLHIFLTSALDRAEWSASRPGHFTHGNESWYTLNRKLGRLQFRFDLEI